MKRYSHFAWFMGLALLGQGYGFSVAADDVSRGSQALAPSDAVLNASIMRPDKATREQWYREWLNAPASKLDPGIRARLMAGGIKPVPLLLDHIVYTPSERNQSSCGNCWVWAGTALAEVKHSIEAGVKDRLSIQWLDSKMFETGGGYACNGGTLNKLVNFYNSYAWRPWSNTNADFKDQAGGAAPHIASAQIGQTPSYPGDLGALRVATIPTTNIAQATAIANIKNVINQKKAVQFNFWLVRQADWNAFFNYWNNQAEATLWNPDLYCNHVQDAGSGGHAVTIVGYDDASANTANHYWLVLNSWGANANRPSGLFRMKMYMNYSCKDNWGGTFYYDREFQSLETVAGKTAFYNSNTLNMATRGTATNYVWSRAQQVNGAWSTWSMQDSPQTPNTPIMATFNTKQYIAVRNLTTDLVNIRSISFDGRRSAWVSLAGRMTNVAPALAVYRNRLYLFIKEKNTSNIFYKSMATNGVWDANWKQVAGGTNYSPSAVAYDDRLFLFVTEPVLGKVFFKGMESNGAWSGWYGLYWADKPMRTNQAPAATVFDNRIYVVVKGFAPANNPADTRISYAYSGVSPTSWIKWMEIPGAGRTSFAPYLGVGPRPNTLNVAVGGVNMGSMYTKKYVLGSGWSQGWAYVPGNGSAPSINNYWFNAEPYVSKPPSLEAMGTATSVD